MYLGDLGRHGGTLGDLLGAIGCHLEAIESHLGTIGDDLGGPWGPLGSTKWSHFWNKAPILVTFWTLCGGHWGQGRHTLLE